LRGYHDAANCTIFDGTERKVGIVAELKCLVAQSDGPIWILIRVERRREFLADWFVF